MKITVEGEHSEILSLKKELAAILRAESSAGPCPCGENLCPGEPCPICGEGNCTGGEECEGPGWAKDSDGVIDDLKDQIQSLEYRNKQLAEDLTTWKAAAANNYELYLRTVREAGAEKDRLAEEVKGLKACRDSVVLFRKQWDKNGCLKPSKSEPIHLAIYDAAEPFMATGEPREFIE